MTGIETNKLCSTVLEEMMGASLPGHITSPNPRIVALNAALRVEMPPPPPRHVISSLV